MKSRRGHARAGLHAIIEAKAEPPPPLHRRHERRSVRSATVVSSRTMSRSHEAIVKLSKTAVVTDDIAESLLVITKHRVPIGAQVALEYRTFGRSPVLATGTVRLQIDGVFAPIELTIEHLQALLVGNQEFVSNEEKAIDFPASLRQAVEDGLLPGPAVQPESPEAAAAATPGAAAPAGRTTAGSVSPPRGTPGPRRGAHKPSSQASSKSGAASAAKNPRGSVMTVELEDGCRDALVAVGLAGYVPALQQARVTTLGYLRDHSVKELQDSLRRVIGPIRHRFGRRVGHLYKCRDK